VSLSALSDIDIASWDHSDGLFCDPNASAEPNLGLDFSINALPSAPPFSEAHPQYDPKNWSGFDSTFVLPGEQTSFDDNPFTDHTQRQQDGSDLDSPWMASLDWAEPELAAGKEHVGHPSMSIASNTSSQSLEDTNVLGKQRLALEDPKS
jgi:hypothetical protein